MTDHRAHPGGMGEPKSKQRLHPIWERGASHNFSSCLLRHTLQSTNNLDGIVPITIWVVHDLTVGHECQKCVLCQFLIIIQVDGPQVVIGFRQCDVIPCPGLLSSSLKELQQGRDTMLTITKLKSGPFWKDFNVNQFSLIQLLISNVVTMVRIWTYRITSLFGQGVAKVQECAGFSSMFQQDHIQHLIRSCDL